MTLKNALPLLLCPECKTALHKVGSTLQCHRKHHRFPIVKDIPIFHQENRHDQHVHQVRYFNRVYQKFRRLPQQPWQDSYWQLAQNLLQLQPGQRLADIGTGTGWLAIKAAKMGLKVVAVDLTLEIAWMVKQFAKDEGVERNLFCIVADAEKLPLKSSVFDCLSAIALIEHLPNHERAAFEFSRVLKYGGRLWIVTPNDLRQQPIVFKIIFSYYDKQLGHLNHYNPAMLKKLFEPFKLSPYNARYIGHLVRLWQLLASEVLKSNWLWWQLERLERKQSSKPTSVNIAVAFKKQ